jgi:TPR repeat protein
LRTCGDAAIPRNLAADIQSDLDALDRLLKEGRRSAEYIQQAFPNRLEIWRRAAEAGLAGGQYLLGRCYAEGCGVDYPSPLNAMVCTCAWRPGTDDTANPRIQKTLV